MNPIGIFIFIFPQPSPNCRLSYEENLLLIKANPIVLLDDCDLDSIQKAIKILDKEHKNKVTILFFFSLVASFLELLGIGIILPIKTYL